jgi:hypothetical protein
MEKNLRIVYSAVFFCSFNMLKHLVLSIVREGIELQPPCEELDRGHRSSQI